MRVPQRVVLSIAFAVLFASGCSKPAGGPLQAASTPYQVRYDQVGYPAGAGERFAVVLSQGKPAPHYRVVDAGTQATVGEGTAAPRVLSTTSRAGTPLAAD